MVRGDGRHGVLVSWFAALSPVRPDLRPDGRAIRMFWAPVSRPDFRRDERSSCPLHGAFPCHGNPDGTFDLTQIRTRDRRPDERLWWSFNQALQDAQMRPGNVLMNGRQDTNQGARDGRTDERSSGRKSRYSTCLDLRRDGSPIRLFQGAKKASCGCSDGRAVRTPSSCPV